MFKDIDGKEFEHQDREFITLKVITEGIEGLSKFGFIQQQHKIISFQNKQIREYSARKQVSVTHTYASIEGPSILTLPPIFCRLYEFMSSFII